MIQRIENMVKGMGEMSLEAIYTWFPKRDKDELRSEIARSSNLVLSGNIVTYADNTLSKKQDVKIIEKEIDFGGKVVTKLKEESQDNNLKMVEPKKEEAPKRPAKVVAKKEESMDMNVSLKQVLDNIRKYNESIESQLQQLNSLSFENKSKAIKRYYEERFIIEENNILNEEGCEFITLKHKQKGVEVAYLLIANNVSKNLVDEIYKNYKYDTVYFCQLDDSSPRVELPLGEFYYKEWNDLISNYMTKYKLVTKKVEVYDIVLE